MPVGSRCTPPLGCVVLGCTQSVLPFWGPTNGTPSCAHRQQTDTINSGHRPPLPFRPVASFLFSRGYYSVDYPSSSWWSSSPRFSEAQLWCSPNKSGSSPPTKDLAPGWREKTLQRGCVRARRTRRSDTSLAERRRSDLSGLDATRRPYGCGRDAAAGRVGPRGRSVQRVAAMGAGAGTVERAHEPLLELNQAHRPNWLQAEARQGLSAEVSGAATYFRKGEFWQDSKPRRVRKFYVQPRLRWTSS
jgi:hypothetical protein